MTQVNAVQSRAEQLSIIGLGCFPNTVGICQLSLNLLSFYGYGQRRWSTLYGFMVTMNLI